MTPPALALPEHALVLARQVVDDHPLRVDHLAAADLRAILAATNLLLRRYLHALAHDHADFTAQP